MIPQNYHEARIFQDLFELWLLNGIDVTGDLGGTSAREDDLGGGTSA